MRAVSLEPAIEIVHAQWAKTRERERHVQWMQNKETAREAIDRAKQLLMDENQFSEADAYRFLQVRSMRSRRSMGVIAEALLLSRSVVHQGGAPEEPKATSASRRRRYDDSGLTAQGNVSVLNGWGPVTMGDR